MNNLANELKERIEREVERKALKTGAMGTENVSIEFTLTDEEMEAFKSIQLPSNYWFDVDGNTVNITYCEEAN